MKSKSNKFESNDTDYNKKIRNNMNNPQNNNDNLN